MILPAATIDYNQQNVGQTNLAIEQADALNHKKNQDLEVGAARLVLKSPDGTRYSITVDNSGNVGATAL
jgi:hypothetical protein|tara:strand:+ start:481 stop:687 length:207 start_codon:yes stop_codon:yes gene_type:complete